jgi:hypothetical protein
LVEQLICNQKVAGSIPAVGTIDSSPNHLQARRNAGRDNGMFKTIPAIVLAIFAGGVLAQTSDAPLSLEVAQQRARFARDQMNAAEDKVKEAQKKDKAAQKRLEEAKAEADKAAKLLQEAQAEAARARERHDQTYKDLKRAHDAVQESKKQQ